jgi:hypothetical protein
MVMRLKWLKGIYAEGGWNLLVATFLSFFALIMSLGTAYLSYVRGVYNVTGQTLEARIEELTGSLNVSAKLIAQIEREITTRKELVSKLERDADEAIRLSTLNADQVAAVAQALRGELRNESKSGFWLSAATNLFFAFLGAAFGELFRWFRARRRRTSVVVGE